MIYRRLIAFAQRLKVFCLLFMFFTAATQAQESIDVWLDVDPANGIGEIDDGLALIQAFHSPELRVRGVSVVFGNAPLRYARNVGFNLVKAFGPRDVPFFAGAESADAFGKENDAVRAMAEALEERPLVIVALGPLTNVGTLLKLFPKLHDRIKSIVIVAGRRPGQKFIMNKDLPAAIAPDFNFESDVPAAQAILDSSVSLVMAPWEVSSKVWVTREDLAGLNGASATGTFLWQTSQHWLNMWESMLRLKGFNPFDTLAIGYLTHPKLIEGSRVHAAIEPSQDETEAGKGKVCLHVYPSDTPKRSAIYLHTPQDEFKDLLLKRLKGPISASPRATIDHGIFNDVLARHVDVDGRVDYQAIKDDPAELDRYIEGLAAVDLSALNRDEHLALLINAYNACTLKLISEFYPIKSIREISEARRWKDQRWMIGGNRWSLDQIEHEQIRKLFNEPAIHFALVCAAKSCPPLRPQAFTGSQLSFQLKDQTRGVHNRDSWVRFDEQEGVLDLTPLYRWYQKDFGTNADAVLNYAAENHAELQKAIDAGRKIEIRWLNYDWSLNSQPKATP